MRVSAAAVTASANSGGDNSPAESFSKAFYRTRLLTFAAMFVGYGCYYLTRNSLGYVVPTLLEDKAVGLTMTQIGGLTSVLPVCYGFSKFLSGVAGARASPRVVLALGLAATAAVNVAFGFGASYAWFLACWGANGLLQGMGAPACARILTAWFPTKERGTWWGFWTASNNIGGFCAPLVAGGAANAMGWRWGMFAPGIIALAIALLLLLVIKDDPETAGFESIDSDASKGSSAKSAAPKPKVKDDRGLLTILLEECLKNPSVWLFAVSYFWVYVIRQSVTSWSLLYLIREKAVPTAAAAVRVSGLELGGLLGSLTAGALSDNLIRRNAGNPEVGTVGLRVKVVIGFTVALTAALFGFWKCPNIAWMQWLSIASVGAALYGPQMIIGLCGAEVVSKSGVSSAQGFLGWVSYLGAACAGVPISAIVQQRGWDAYFLALLASCAIVLALLAPTLNLKSREQLDAAKAA